MIGNTYFTEELEMRRLLAAQVVNIDGTSDGDTIAFERSGSTITVTTNGQAQTFNRADVIRFVVDGDDGDDRIDATGLNIRMTLNGQDGDDTIFGSAKSDRLIGGDGDDEILGNKGHDFVRGEAGEDTLRGNRGNDTLEGGSGEDTMRGDRGNDHIDANDDFFEDQVSGNSGQDSAEVDDDSLINDNVDTVEDVSD